MPFRQHLANLLSGGSHISQFPGSQSSQPAPSAHPIPPPIPTASKPSWPAPSDNTNSPHPYWHPTFSPSIPVTEYFRHELGAHGWGNNELQNYTANPTNSFHTADDKLVLRAIANSSAAGGQDKFTSARLTSQATLSRSRGCITAVLTAPCATGIWPAFWLLPADPFTWPHEGEVDIMEVWNGERTNHSCLHWGFFNGEDAGKHRVVETNVPGLDDVRGTRFGFAWEQRPDPNTQGGRCIWYIDGRPVMKAEKPAGTRRFEDWRVILNVACGGNVCGGKVPADGFYDFVVHDMRMCDEPDGGWPGFERDWASAREGHGM